MKNCILVGLNYNNGVVYYGQINEDEITELGVMCCDENNGMLSFDEGFELVIGNENIEELKEKMNKIWEELEWGSLEFEKLKDGGKINVVEFIKDLLGMY